MRPYAERLCLRKPLYLSAQLFKPKDDLLDALFCCFDFSPILVNSEREHEDWKKRFSDVEAAVRSNTDEIEAKGRALLFGNVPELGDYF